MGIEHIPRPDDRDQPSAAEMLGAMALHLDKPEQFPKIQTQPGEIPDDGKYWYMAVDREQSGQGITTPGTSRKGTFKLYEQETPEEPLTEITWKSEDPNDVKVQVGDEGIQENIEPFYPVIEKAYQNFPDLNQD